jgi:alpha-tubulin suppressor-like RCC1 family protein
MPGLGAGVSAISGTCALKEGGVWCWGDNSNGQLGNNSPPYSLVPVAVQFMPPGAGDLAEAADGKLLPSQTSTDSADHRGTYVLAGTASAAALAIVAAGTWAMRRRLISR